MASKRPRSSTSPNNSANRRKKKEEKANTKKKNQKFLDSIQVPLNNRFDALSDIEMTLKEPIEKKVKFAPIVVTDMDANIHKLVTDLKLTCDLKLTSVGKKIFPKSAEDKTKIIAALNKEKIHFFTHANSDNKTFKAVLRGLPEIDTAIIVDSLTTSHKITPTKVVMFNTKASSKLYLCYFDSSTVNMKTLNTIKCVYYHIVSWQTYRPKNKSVTQCFRCTMYGHGISTCCRFAVCMLCGNNHLTTECTVIDKDTENPTYKCFNCASAKLNHEHKASDPNCPFRAKYIATIDKARGNKKVQLHKQLEKKSLHTNTAPAST